MTGSAGQKRVPEGFLETLEIPLPNISAQQQIAGRLEQTDRLRRTRRYALELNETLLPSRFLEMFGDRLRKGPFRQLGDVVRITGGGTPARENSGFFRGRIPWLTSKDMRGELHLGYRGTHYRRCHREQRHQSCSSRVDSCSGQK